MKILMVASEAFPFFKSGGLGDVSAALSQTLAANEENQVVLFLPRYRDIFCSEDLMPKAISGKFLIPMRDAIETVTLGKTQWGKVQVYFVENARFFDRPGMYRSPQGDYWDNDERFAFFSKAVLEGAKFLGFKPDIIHCHDWQTGLIPAYLNTLYRIDSFFAKTASVFTINNLAYQGMFSKESLYKAGFSENDFTPDKLEFYGGMNYMKAALVYADLITTVSPTYADEIQNRADLGYGLDGVLRSRSSDLSGILNGIDVNLWNPQTDKMIYKKYDVKTYAKGKAENKEALQKKLGLKVDSNVIMAGIVSRMDYQKGLDPVLHIAHEFTDRMQFVVLGSGDPWLTEGFNNLSGNHKGMVAYSSKFDEPLAHQIYAASDLFIMPSRFEPCGLSQMIAMRYGALPVVTRTGGLMDTVKYSDTAEQSNGFAIDYADDEPLRNILNTAIDSLKNKAIKKTMILNAMKGDYSWTQSSLEYTRLYRNAMERKQ